jgi:hypothetical protein
MGQKAYLGCKWSVNAGALLPIASERTFHDRVSPGNSSTFCHRPSRRASCHPLTLRLRPRASKYDTQLDHECTQTKRAPRHRVTARIAQCISSSDAPRDLMRPADSKPPPSLERRLRQNHTSPTPAPHPGGAPGIAVVAETARRTTATIGSPQNARRPSR